MDRFLERSFRNSVKLDVNDDVIPLVAMWLGGVFL